MKTLCIINDPPYGTERVFNALRLAHALLKHDDAAEVRARGEFFSAEPAWMRAA